MNRLKHLKETRAAKELEMKAIMDLCATENRNRKPEEKTKWDALKVEVDGMRDEITALEEQEAIDARSAKPVGNPAAAAKPAKPESTSMRDVITAWKEKNQDAIDAVRTKTEQRNIPALEFRAVADLTLAKLNAGGSAFLPNAGVQPGIVDLVRNQPTFWSRLPKRRTNLNPLIWTYKTNKEGAANFIGEGVLKPQVSFELATEQSVPKKVAERMRVSTEMLNDVPGLESLIRNEMIYEIEMHANAAVLLDAAATSTDPAGVTNLASGFTLTTIEAGGSPTYADSIRAAIAQLASLNYTSNITAFINPIDAANMDLSKSADDGHYLMPPFVSQSGMVVAGVPVYTDQGIPVGSLLIGDMSKYVIWMVEDLTVRFGLNGDDFAENMVTVIAEMRFHQTFASNHTGAFIYDTFANIQAAITTT